MLPEEDLELRGCARCSRICTQSEAHIGLTLVDALLNREVEDFRGCAALHLSEAQEARNIMIRNTMLTEQA